MKKLILLLFVILLFSACKKGADDVDPILNEISGEWIVDYFYTFNDLDSSYNEMSPYHYHRVFKNYFKFNENDIILRVPTYTFQFLITDKINNYIITTATNPHTFNEFKVIFTFKSVIDNKLIFLYEEEGGRKLRYYCSKI